MHGTLGTAMRRTLGTALLVVGVVIQAASLASAPDTQWKIDAGHTSPQFSVKHLGIAYVHGSFLKTEGTVQYDPSDVSKTVIDITIDTNSIDTGLQLRDNVLRSAYYLDVQKFPSIIFKSKKVESTKGGGLKVTGDLMIKGVTKEVVLDVDPISEPAKAPNGRLHIGTQARLTILRRTFGVGNDDTVAVGDSVKITIDIDLFKS